MQQRSLQSNAARACAAGVPARAARVAAGARAGARRRLGAARRGAARGADRRGHGAAAGLEPGRGGDGCGPRLRTSLQPSSAVTAAQHHAAAARAAWSICAPCDAPAQGRTQSRRPGLAPLLSELHAGAAQLEHAPGGDTGITGARQFVVVCQRPTRAPGGATLLRAEATQRCALCRNDSPLSGLAPGHGRCRLCFEQRALEKQPAQAQNAAAPVRRSPRSWPQPQPGACSWRRSQAGGSRLGLAPAAGWAAHWAAALGV